MGNGPRSVPCSANQRQIFNNTGSTKKGQIFKRAGPENTNNVYKVGLDGNKYKCVRQVVLCLINKYNKSTYEHLFQISVTYVSPDCVFYSTNCLLTLNVYAQASS